MSDFSDRLKEAIEKSDLTQRELAERLGLTETSISRYVRGVRIPRATTIPRIAKVLNVSVESLLSDEKDEEPEEIYHLTPWGCLSVVLTDYGVDISGITPAIGVHLVEDFMDSLVRQGLLVKENGK